MVNLEVQKSMVLNEKRLEYCTGFVYITVDQ